MVDTSWYGTEDRRSSFCVIGTSNAIFRDGYAAHLATHPGIASVDNLSLGGSSSNLFAYRRAATDFSKFDVCILDFCVNDTTLLSSSFQNQQNVIDSLEDAIATCLSQNCIPALFMLPLQNADGNPIPDIYRHVANEWKIPFFDGYAALRAISTSAQIPYDSLFEDPFHIYRWLAAAFAQWTADGLLTALNTPRIGSNRHITSAHHRYLDLRQCISPQHKFKHRQTSLAAAPVLDLNPGTALDVPVPDHTSIVAIVADFAHAHGTVCLSGTINSRLCLSSLDIRDDDTDLVLKAWPVPIPIKPLNGMVRVSVMDDTAFDVGLWHPLSEMQKNTPVSVGLCGFILRDGNTTRLARNWHYDPLDLASYNQDSYIEPIIRRLRESS
jgi:hypothetical protein